MPRIIGLDLGTSTVTGVLVDTAGAAGLPDPQVEAATQRSNDSAISTRLPTRAEQDLGRLRTLALDTLSELVARRDRVDGIAVTGQMHGLICLDQDGRPLTPHICWQDRRTAEALSDGSTTLQRVHARVKDLDWRTNGCRLAHGYGATMLVWLVDHGELPSGTHRICTLPDWLTGQLTGQLPMTDPTLAASWGIYDLVTNRWNAGFLSRLGVNESLLPPVRRSGEELGGLSRDAARTTGLQDGVPVFNALGDNQASFLGSVADPRQSLLVNLGSGGQICWMRPKFESPTEALETRPHPAGVFLRVGASLCGGAAYAWLNDTARSWLAEFGVHRDRAAVYTRLNALAATCEDPAGLTVRPTFLGSRADPTVTTGAIEGITAHHLRNGLRLGSLARATLLGMVEELVAIYSSARGSNLHRQLVATGGAVRRISALPSILQEMFGLPVEIPSIAETAALGVALQAARLGSDHRATDPTHDEV